MSQTKTTNITLEVSAEIDLNGFLIEDLERHLHAALSRAIGNGLLTGDTQAEVEQYSATVSVNPDNDQDRQAESLRGEQTAIADLKARLESEPATPKAIPLPSGWVVMPPELSRSMIDAAQKVEEDGYDAMYQAMKRTRPSIPKGEGNA